MNIKDSNKKTSTFPNLARLEFLAGGVAAAALVACGGGKTSYVTPTLGPASSNENPELARLMRKTGVREVVSHGVTYRDDGKQFPPGSGNVGIRPSTAGTVDGDSGGTGAPPSPTPPPTIIWEFVGGSGLSINLFSGDSGESLTALTFIGPAGPGDTYVINTPEPPSCNNPIADLADFADQVVNYIENNAGNFSQALLNTSTGAAIGWRGTAMGTAAAAEAAADFLAIVFAGVSFWEILIMLAALGVMLYLVYEMIKCATGH